MTDWQPIAEAKRDGTKYILAKFDWTTGSILDPFGDYPKWHMWWAASGHWSDKWKNWNDGLEPTGLAGPTHFQEIARPAPNIGPDGCAVPPPGWYCTRQSGHSGPCAAIEWMPEVQTNL